MTLEILGWPIIKLPKLHPNHIYWVVVSNVFSCSPLPREMIQFYLYFWDGMVQPQTRCRLCRKFQQGPKVNIILNSSPHSNIATTRYNQPLLYNHIYTPKTIKHISYMILKSPALLPQNKKSLKWPPKKSEKTYFCPHTPIHCKNL